MSFFSFLKRNKESYSLVFSLGSGGLSGALVRFTEKAGEEIVHHDYEPIPFQQDISITRHVELLKSSLATLAGRMRSGQPISRIFYVFSAPWCISQTKTIRVKEVKSFKVTESYLDRIISEQESKFKSNISYSGQIIEKKIIQIKINGYIVNKIHGQQAKELEISIFFTIVPENILSIVESAISRTFNVKNVWCHSSALATFSVIRDLFPHKDDFIQIDVGDEVTDIMIIRNSVVVTSASVPFGRHSFIRELSANLNVSKEVADSQIRLYRSGSNNELANIKLAVSLDAVAKNWLQQIFDVLDKLKETIYVPDSIFLIANNDLTSFLKDKLEKKDFTVIIPENNKIKLSTATDNLLFKLELMFLDNNYKI